MSEAARPELHRSSRRPESLATVLADWLATKLDGCDGRPEVTMAAASADTGMSSDTVLVDVEHTSDGVRRVEPLVARIAPDRSDVPVFPSYDLARQFAVIRRVGELTRVPVPRLRWLEPDAGVIDSPFFVMERVEDDVPPDVLPYNFGDSWLFDASTDDQRRLQDATAALLAELHSIDDPAGFGFLAFPDAGATPLQRHLAHTEAWYRFAAADGGRSTVVEEALSWLHDRMPAGEGAEVVSWGDARIGNVIYRDFLPVAVLDWEMAGLGPRELNVSWLIHAHATFEYLASQFDLPGMPSFLRADDVVDHYVRLTGYELRDLDWYYVYAAAQWAIVFLRTGRRQIHFGERQEPDEIDELLYNRGQLEAMVSGGTP